MIDKNGVALTVGDMVLIRKVGVFTIIEPEVGRFALVNAPININKKEFIRWEVVNKAKIEKYEHDTSWFKMFNQTTEGE
jgi:hypothetical protein